MLIDREHRAVFSNEIRRRGRRSNFDHPATVRIGVRVTAAQLDDLRRVAQVNQTDLSGVIREAVNGYVADFRDDDPVFRRT